MSLKTKAISGVKWTVVATVLTTAAQSAQLAILARYLQPVDFGLMAIMMIVIGFSQAFQDMGISNAIIHHQEITHDQLSSLYWLNIFSGLALSLIVLLISPLIAAIYDEPRITGLLAMLSSVFLITAVGNQYRVLYQKYLVFRTPAIINTFSALVSLTTAVYFAMQGIGVESLVYAMLCQALASSGLFLWFGLRRFHRPGLIYRHTELKGFYGFGLYQMGERSINYISANVDKMLIGKFVGMGELGFYNLAWQLIIFPLIKINPIINSVAFPVYAKLQNDSERLNSYYKFNVSALSIVTVPLLSFLVFFSEEVVAIIYGQGWKETASLAQSLAFVGILKALGNPGGALILALGHANVGFWWNVVWASAIVVTLGIGLLLSPTLDTVVFVLVGLSLTLGFGWHILIAKVGRIRYWSIAGGYVRIFFVSMIIAWCGQFIVNNVGLNYELVRVIVALVFCALAYMAYLFIGEKEIVKKVIGK